MGAIVIKTTTISVATLSNIIENKVQLLHIYLKVHVIILVWLVLLLAFHNFVVPWMLISRALVAP